MQRFRIAMFSVENNFILNYMTLYSFQCIDICCTALRIDIFIIGTVGFCTTSYEQGIYSLEHIQVFASVLKYFKAASSNSNWDICTYLNDHSCF